MVWGFVVVGPACENEVSQAATERLAAAPVSEPLSQSKRDSKCLKAHSLRITLNPKPPNRFLLSKCQGLWIQDFTKVWCIRNSKR